MASSQKYKEGPVSVDVDHEGKATLKYIKELKPRLEAFKRQMLWAAASDLLEMIIEKIPTDKKYQKLIKALKIGEIKMGRDGSAFAVFIDNKAKRVKPIDGPKTVLYVRARRKLDRTKEDVKILIDMGPWTVDTIPFWPSKADAVVIQRKVDKKIVDKIAKMQDGQAGKVARALAALGKNNPDKEKSKKYKISRKNKSMPDIAYEMTTLEFGGGSDKAIALWRRSLKDLYPGKMKTVLSRYPKIDATIHDTRYKGWKNYPLVKDKLTKAIISSFSGFQKRLGY